MMICVSCNDSNTKCIDDILQVGYVAELYRCESCNGYILVEYHDGNIRSSNIKKYKYLSVNKRGV